MPDNYELKGKAYIDDEGRKHGFVPGCCWYTNLDIAERLFARPVVVFIIGGKSKVV